MTDKTAPKTAPLPPTGGARLPLGNHPGNTGGKKGRSGRHPDVWKQFLAKLRGDPKFHKAIKAAAHDSESRGFSSAIKLATDYDESKPAQRSDVTTAGKPISGIVVLPAVEP